MEVIFSSLGDKNKRKRPEKKSSYVGSAHTINVHRVLVWSRQCDRQLCGGDGFEFGLPSGAQAPLWLGCSPCDGRNILDWTWSWVNSWLISIIIRAYILDRRLFLIRGFVTAFKHLVTETHRWCCPLFTQSNYPRALKNATVLIT